MIALLNGKINQENGLMTFEIIKPIEVETIVSDSSMEERVVNYLEGSTVEGFPSDMTLINPLNKLPIQDGSQAEGILVEIGDGHVIIPFNAVKEVSLIEDVKGKIDEAIESSKSLLPTDGILGFTYKQILFIGLFTIIVTKIVKN
jgi:hypothetical protein